MAGAGAAAIYQEFGALVRSERESQHLTQLELSKRVQLARASIANIESGRQSVLLHQYLDISAALGLEPSKLLPISSYQVGRLEPENMPKAVVSFIASVQPKKTVKGRLKR
jgi:transcriptional regulator with XRE-family HTH domain